MKYDIKNWLKGLQEAANKVKTSEGLDQEMATTFLLGYIKSLEHIDLE